MSGDVVWRFSLGGCWVVCWWWQEGVRYRASGGWQHVYVGGLEHKGTCMVGWWCCSHVLGLACVRVCCRCMVICWWHSSHTLWANERGLACDGFVVVGALMAGSFMLFGVFGPVTHAGVLPAQRFPTVDHASCSYHTAMEPAAQPSAAPAVLHRTLSCGVHVHQGCWRVASCVLWASARNQVGCVHRRLGLAAAPPLTRSACADALL